MGKGLASARETAVKQKTVLFSPLRATVDRGETGRVGDSILRRVDIGRGFRRKGLHVRCSRSLSSTYARFS